METAESDRQLIEKILADYAKVAYSNSDVRLQTVFDRDQDQYLLMLNGWEGVRRIHGCLVHVDIIDGKFWIRAMARSIASRRSCSTPGCPRTASCWHFVRWRSAD